MAETTEECRTETSSGTNAESHLRADHNAAKRKVFLEQLAITSSVTQSAAIAGIAHSTLYSWKKSDPDFAAAWLEALAAGYELLEMEMLERARQGVERKIFHHGKHVATVRDYDHRAALQLLRMHKEAVALVRAARAEVAAQAEPVRDTLEEKLKKVNMRLRAFQAEKRRKRQKPDPETARCNDSERVRVIDAL